LVIGESGNRIRSISISDFPDSRFPIPDSRFQIPDSRFPIPRYRLPVTRYGF